jgi:histone demethylase JARID1
MYEVRYTRFRGARGKAISETVCEQRVRVEPPEILSYKPKVGDYVDAYWWDGWWHGYVTDLDEDEEDGRSVNVRFPDANDQQLKLQAEDIRQHVQYGRGTGQWQKKLPIHGKSTDGETSSSLVAPEFEWVALQPSEFMQKRTTAAKKRAREERSEARKQAEKQPRLRQPIPDLPLCPTFHPTQEEFMEPLRYIASIRAEVEPYGCCKVVPPEGWNPEWPINLKSFDFATRVQNVHQLQERGEFAFWKQLKESLARQNIPLKVVPRLNGKQIDIFTLYRFVARLGGHHKVTKDAKWAQVADELGVSKRLETRADLVQQVYAQYLQEYEEEQRKRADSEKEEKQVLAGSEPDPPYAPAVVWQKFAPVPEQTVVMEESEDSPKKVAAETAVDSATDRTEAEAEGGAIAIEAVEGKPLSDRESPAASKTQASTAETAAGTAAETQMLDSSNENDERAQDATESPSAQTADAEGSGGRRARSGKKPDYREVDENSEEFAEQVRL